MAKCIVDGHVNGIWPYLKQMTKSCQITVFLEGGLNYGKQPNTWYMAIIKEGGHVHRRWSFA